MALVTMGASGWFQTFVFKDTQGDEASMEIELNVLDFAAAQALANLLYAELVVMSNAVIVKSYLAYRLEENAFAYPVGADVSVKARCTWQLANRSEKATRDIPSPANGIFVAANGPDNNIVNSTNQNIIDFTALFAGGGALMSDGEEVDGFLNGQRVTVRKRKTRI